jgi:hypothetical protein
VPSDGKTAARELRAFAGALQITTPETWGIWRELLERAAKELEHFEVRELCALEVYGVAHGASATLRMLAGCGARNRHPACVAAERSALDAADSLDRAVGAALEVMRA